MSDTPKVVGSPDVIYLVYGELEHDDTHDNLVDESGGEVTWCSMPQFQSDVCYARMDILMEARKECAELRTVLSDARVKLQLYRSAHSGEYVGGIEFTALISRIDTMMKGE